MSINRRIAAVVVTFNRLELLQRLVTRLRSIEELDHILVVDNCSDDGTAEWLNSQQDHQLDYRVLPENRGGAGGFQAGLQWSHDLGFDLSWLMDDDGIPTKDCLAKLLAHEGKYDFWGPAVLAEQKPADLCFPVRLPGTAKIARTHDELHEVSQAGVVADVVIPFNGVLVTRELVSIIGTPRAEFFIWGDDVEYLWRARESGAEVATIVDAEFLHPATDDLGTPMMFGKTTYNHSPSDLKHYCMARNNTANLLAYRSPLHAWAFWFKTSWFYTFVRPSFRRLRLSAQAIRDGLNGDFNGHKRFLKPKATPPELGAEQLAELSVAVVIVTYQRPELLDVLLHGLSEQTRPADAIYVIDNGGDEQTKQVLAKYSQLPLVIDHTGENLGGAGGFNRGVRSAYEAGHDRIWLMDDDVIPAPWTLEVLLRDGGEVLACTREDPNGRLIELAATKFDLQNPLQIRPKVSTVEKAYGSREQMPKRVHIENAAFEGFFIHRDVVTRIGLPDPSFFIFYDDCDFQLRAQRAGYEMFMLRDALVRRQVHFLQADNLASWKGFYMYRNLFVVHFRYGKNFLVRRKPWLITLGVCVLSPLRGGKKECVNVRRALKEARTMRKLDDRAKLKGLAAYFVADHETFNA